MKNKLRINLLASWADHALGVLIGLFLMPFVLRTIGDEQYGQWLLICSVIGYSGLLNLGFADTVSRFVAHHHAQDEIPQINRVVSVIGLVYLGIGVLLAGLTTLAVWLVPSLCQWEGTSASELRTVVALLGASAAVGILGSVFGGVIVGLQRMEVERGIRSIAGLVRFGLTVVFLQQQQGLTTLAVVFLVTTLVENLGYAVVVFRLLPGLRLSLSLCRWETLRECGSFSMYSMLEGISIKLVEATDTVVIGCLLGTKFVVPYYVSLRLTQFIAQPLQVIGLIAMPRGAALGAVQHTDQLLELVRKGVGFAFLLIGAFFIGACFFGDLVLHAWVGQSYEQSHLLLLVLLGAQVIATPMRVLRGVLFGLGHARVPALVYFCEAVANLVLSLLLIQPLGVLGVALGTAIPVFVVELFVLLPYALKTLKFEWSPFLRSIVVPQLLPLLALWAYSSSVSAFLEVGFGRLPVFVVSAGGGVVLAGSWWFARQMLRRESALAM